MKVTDLIEGEWYQVRHGRNWIIAKFHKINAPHMQKYSDNLCATWKERLVPEEAWFGFGKIAMTDESPKAMVPTKGIQLRPVTEETKVEIVRIRTELAATREKVTALRQEWTELVGA